MPEKMSNTVPSLIRNEKGQGLTEYITLLLLISVISIVAAKSLGSTVKDKIQLARKHINEEITLE